MVRLVNGSVPSEGRLEVFYNNTWGTVCDDYFSNTEGDVVCRQLNYIGLVSVVLHPSVFGSGEGPIWLDDVDCNGSEDSIFDCYHNDIGVHNCQHSEDVGIICGKHKIKSTSCRKKIFCSVNFFFYLCCMHYANAHLLFMCMRLQDSIIF